jgi:integrase
MLVVARLVSLRGTLLGCVVRCPGSRVLSLRAIASLVQLQTTDAMPLATPAPVTSVQPASGHLIQRAFWLLREILSKLTLMARASDPTSVVAFEWDLLDGLRPRTKTTYLRAIAEWSSWAGAAASTIHFSWELDASIYDYGKTTSITRSRLQHLITAVERVSPHCKGRLTLGVALVRCLQETHPPKHTTPMPWTACLCMAWWLAVNGHARVGGLLILQWAGAMRPSEVISLSVDDITVSSLPSSMGSIIIKFAAKLRTKVHRPQIIILRPSHAPIAIHVVKAFLSSTRAGCRLTSLSSTAQYGRYMKQAMIGLKVPELWTPHSPRAGWASDSTLRGISFTEIQEHGRWVSDTALRHYLDEYQRFSSYRQNLRCAASFSYSFHMFL